MEKQTSFGALVGICDFAYDMPSCRIERTSRCVGNMERSISVIGLPPRRDILNALIEWDFPCVDTHIALVIGHKAIDIYYNRIGELHGILDDTGAESDTVFRV